MILDIVGGHIEVKDLFTPLMVFVLTIAYTSYNRRQDRFKAKQQAEDEKLLKIISDKEDIEKIEAKQWAKNITDGIDNIYKEIAKSNATINQSNKLQTEINRNIHESIKEIKQELRDSVKTIHRRIDELPINK